MLCLRLVLFANRKLELRRLHSGTSATTKAAVHRVSNAEVTTAANTTATATFATAAAAASKGAERSRPVGIGAFETPRYCCCRCCCGGDPTATATSTVVVFVAVAQRMQPDAVAMQYMFQCRDGSAQLAALYAVPTGALQEGVVWFTRQLFWCSARLRLGRNANY